MNHAAAIGTQRRLQAAAVMGYGIPQVIAYMPRVYRERLTAMELLRVRAGLAGDVDVELAATVARVYRRIVALPGLDPAVAERARSRGWAGPSAWDEAALDDPAAEPVDDDPDEWDHAGLAGEYVDEVAVKKAIREHDARPLSRAERLEAARRLAHRCHTVGSLAHQLGLSTHVATGLVRRLAEIERKALELAS